MFFGAIWRFWAFFDDFEQKPKKLKLLSCCNEVDKTSDKIIENHRKMRKFSNPTAAFTTRMQTSKRYYLSSVPTSRISSLDVVSNINDAFTDVAPFSFTSQTISADNTMNGIDTTMTYTSANDVLSTQDIVVGTIIAFILAFGYSYLNGQSSSTSFVSWPSQSNNENFTLEDVVDISMEPSDVDLGSDERTFNADNWKEMSREENYILYNTKIRQKSNPDYNKMGSTMQNENDDMAIRIELN